MKANTTSDAEPGSTHAAAAVESTSAAVSATLDVQSRGLPGGAPPRQVSWSSSGANVLRGMHTSPYAKVVTVVRGSCSDVLADARPGSPAFGRALRVELSAGAPTQLLVAAGVAHGFLAGEEGVDMLYLQEDTFGSRGGETDVAFSDHAWALPWPLERLGGNLAAATVSDKDAAAPTLRERFPEAAAALAAEQRVLVDRALVGQYCAPPALVIGASGQVGQAIRAEIARRYPGTTVVGTYCAHRPLEDERRMREWQARPAGDREGHPPPPLPSMYFDLAAAADECGDGTGRSHADVLLECVRPGAVFICAAATWVDGCERPCEAGKVHATNVVGPAAVCEAAGRLGATVLYFSSDYVFDGKGEVAECCLEESAPRPLNTYGLTKAQGEAACMAAGGRNVLVLRTAVVYGPEAQGKNFVYQLARKGAAREAMAVQGDHSSSPTYSADLAAAACLLARKLALGEVAGGVYNVAGPEVMSRLEFARRVACCLPGGATAPPLREVATAELEAQAKQRLGFAARRPLAVGLPLGKVRAALGAEWRPRTVEEAMRAWAEHEAPCDKPLGQ